MTEDTKKELLKEPYNPTDPIVVFDPEYSNGTVVKIFDDVNSKGNFSPQGAVSAVKDDAINIPVVKMNNTILKDNQIDFVKIFYEGFMPKIKLSVKDDDSLVRTMDMPGMDNEIQVVITSEINGYYKKINLQFYIVNINIYDEFISYDGVFKFPPLNVDILKQIGKGKGKLNTYDMLSEIAKEVKLGFAASPKCQDVKDERYRLCQSQKYKDFIEEQLTYAGLDEDSIFDCWIDLFGYLVMVNVPYIMNENIEPEQLMIYSMFGEHSEVEENTEVSAIQLQRTLTNNKMNEGNYNLLFTNYQQIVDNSKIYQDGALSESFYMTGAGVDNKINTEQIQIIEPSLDGMLNSEKYEYKKSKFLGVEFNKDMPILFKTELNEKYFAKLRYKRLKVELDNYNIGLERGTLVNVLIKEYDQNIIKAMNGNKDPDESASGFMNPYASGMYYIDSMEFVYKSENHKIQQYIYLVKKGMTTSPSNKIISPIKDEVES
jgi:hypothetical protein